MSFQLKKSHSLFFLMMLDFISQVPAQGLEVTWITRYCNEEIKVADLSSSPRMLRNIQNSLMTEAPSYLDDSIYLQRRTIFNLCPDLEGIAEPAREWLRPDRVEVSDSAIVIAAIREDLFPGAHDLLVGLGWLSLDETIRLGYFSGATDIPLYAGFIPAGPVHLSGAGINSLLNESDPTISSIYFFFLEENGLPPEQVARLNSVSIPEASALPLCALATCGLSFMIRKSLV